MAAQADARRRACRAAVPPVRLVRAGAEGGPVRGGRGEADRGQTLRRGQQRDDRLLLSLLALDLPPNSRVAVPDYGWPAAANAARLLGHRVVLTDVYQSTGCVCPMDLIGRTIEGCKAVVAIDTWGNFPHKFRDMRTLCDNRNVPLIEDACQAFGTPGAGRTGTVGVFSFAVAKIVTGGQGGAVVTDSDRIAGRLRRLVEHGGGEWKRTRLVEAAGGNFRMADMQAALALSQLRRLDRLMEAREQVYRWYAEGGVAVRQNASYATVKGGRPLAEFLNSRGVAAVEYHRPLHESPVFAGQADFVLRTQAMHFPGAVKAAEAVLLPSWGVTRREVRLVCSLIREWKDKQNGDPDPPSDGRTV